jgi:hypothetical protein
LCSSISAPIATSSIDQHAHLEHGVGKLRHTRRAQLEQQHHRLQQLHQYQRDDDRTDRLQAVASAIGGKQAEDRRDQRKVAQAIAARIDAP